MGWRDRMNNVVAGAETPSDEDSEAEPPPEDRRRQFAFEYELVREQGRPIDY